LITRLALACSVMAVCVAIHASGLAWAIGWLRRRPARLPGFAPHVRLFIVMAVVDRPRLRIPDAQQGARTPPGRRVISLAADPSGRLIRWRNRAGHGGGDRQPRVLRSDGDSEGLQVRPVHGLERPSLGQLHQGLHKPIISRDLFARVQDVFAAANHSKHTKRRHAFAGLVTCGRCGCAFTAETKKGQYVYSRTRANRLFIVCCEKSARTGASCKNARIELDVRSRKSFTDLH
jgi:hypothetical protein